MDDAQEPQSTVADSTQVEVECLSCGRRGTLAGDEQRLAGGTLVQLTRRLRCSVCGSRAVKARSVRTPADLARAMRGRMGRPGG